MDDSMKDEEVDSIEQQEIKQRNPTKPVRKIKPNAAQREAANDD